MILYGIKDACAKKFVQVIPGVDDSVLRRDLKNIVNTPSKSLFFTNSDDFRVYKLGEFDEAHGSIQACADPQPLFYLSDLKNAPEVQ